MIVRDKTIQPPLKKPVLFSLVVHTILILSIILIPDVRFKKEKATKVIWVQIPKGTSDEIGLGIKKSEGLPKTTIEQQKQFMRARGLPAAGPEGADAKMKAPPIEPEKTISPDKMTIATKDKDAPKVRRRRRRVSTTDRKIANALAMIDRDLATRKAAPPEAAQVSENGEGYIYGTGTEPLRVMPEDPEYIKYQAMVRAKIIQEWVLPLRYIEEGHPSRKCALEVMINEDGDVFSTRWETKSGDKTFDDSALRAVKKASPFPKPPERLAWEAYNEGFLIEFDPSLKPQG